MNKYFHELIFYTRSQRLGILALTLLIVIILLTERGYLHYRDHQHIQTDSTSTTSAQQEIRAFFSSLQPVPPTRRPRQAALPVAYKRIPFNPNTADSLTFRQLGLPNWMVRNILRYRAKGGRFRKADDFKKVYGLSESLFAELLPYIEIPPDTTVNSSPSKLLLTSADSLSKPKIEKYTPGTQIELNTADTTELKKIPGIGSGIARMIVVYRQQLGGFYSLQQLKEIHLNDSLLQPWLYLDETRIQRLRVNQASVAQLSRHPYINFYQAKALVDYRHHNGPIHNLKPFILLEEFTETDLQRMRHYLDFREK